MIQRVQTLYLLISVIFFAMALYFPIAYGNLFEIHSYGIYTPDGQELEEVSTFYFIIPMAIAGLLTISSLFLYSSRKRQMAIIRLSIILFAICFALLALCIWDCRKLLTPGDNFVLGAAFYMLFLSLFLNLFAYRAIRKDDKLVRSIDRIR